MPTPNKHIPLTQDELEKLFDEVNKIIDLEDLDDLLKANRINKRSSRGPIKNINFNVPIAMSNRHIHLTQDHLEQLFGKGYKLTKLKDLTQPNQFACEEKIDIQGPKGIIKQVRILGPVRPETQIELSIADSFILGLKPPIRDSGKLDNTPGITIIGPAGKVELNSGVIIAARHIHMHTNLANKYGLKDQDLLKVNTKGQRGLTFNNVLVRVSDSFALEMHVDIEEGNAAGVKNGQLVEAFDF